MTGTHDVVFSFPKWLPATQTWMFNQAVYLTPPWRCRVVCSVTDNLDQFDLPNIHCLPKRPPIAASVDRVRARLGFDPRQELLDRTIRSHAVAIVHSHFGHVGWQDSATVSRNNLAHVVSFYGQDVSRLPTVDPRWRARYREMFARVTAVLCEGEAMREDVIKLGCPPQKVRVHRLGVDLRRIPFVPRQWAPGTRLRILIASSFQEKKGIPLALKALATVVQDVDLDVRIVGDATSEARSEEEKRIILSTIHQLGLTGRVEMLGYLPQAGLMEEAYSSHIFMAPSRTASDGDTEGGAPVALIEMIASGMLVVTTRHKDIPGIVRHFETGWLADEDSIEGLADGLRYFASSPDSWRQVQERARQRVVDHFDAVCQGARLTRIYEEILQGTS